MASAPTSGPRRGDVWLVSFGAARGREPGKNRPAIVLLPDRLYAGTTADLIPVVPLSSSVRRSPLRPEVTVPGVDRPSRAICRGVRGVTSSRLLRMLGALDARALSEVEQSLALVLGLAPQPK